VGRNVRDKSEQEQKNSLARACRSIDDNYKRIHKDLVDRAVDAEVLSPEEAEATKAHARVGLTAAKLWHHGLQWALEEFEALKPAERFKAIDAAQKAISTLQQMVPAQKDQGRSTDFDQFMWTLARKHKITIIQAEIEEEKTT
jgi:hypothetical protein